MGVILIRLSGPMQSWGVQSRFTVRDTGLEPSKSGVVGLLCAALGRSRQESVEDLAVLRMAVRVDQEPTVERDYQTAMDVLRASGKGIKPTEPSTRYYLTDARFLVGLQGRGTKMLGRLHDALRDPHWCLYLGRKAFVPGEPVWLEDGLVASSRLLQTLMAYPWLGVDPDRAPERVRVVIEDPDGSEVRYDQPLSFSARHFAPRRVSTRFLPAPPFREGVGACTSHG